MLTPREMEIGQMVSKGVPTKVIAAQLGISERTVYFHVQEAARRIGGSTAPRHQLMMYMLSAEMDD